VVDPIPGLVWSTRPDGSGEFSNQRWLEYTGLSAEQALDRGWRVTIHPDDFPRMLEAFHEALSLGRSFEVEGPFRRWDGQFRGFIFRGNPLLAGSGKVVKWYGTNTDLEERKQAEALPSQSIFLTGEKKGDYMAAEPADDAGFIPVYAHSLEHTGGYTPAEVTRVAGTLLPDILLYDPTRPASYPENGRKLSDDAIDVFLSIITNGKVTRSMESLPLEAASH
jgi:PAS domain S-box-containing protein